MRFRLTDILIHLDSFSLSYKLIIFEVIKKLFIFLYINNNVLYIVNPYQNSTSLVLFCYTSNY